MTRDFLRKLIYPKETPGVPKAIRLQAGNLLRHYPGQFHMEESMRLAPEIWGSLKEFPPAKDGEPTSANREEMK